MRKNIGDGSIPFSHRIGHVSYLLLYANVTLLNSNPQNEKELFPQQRRNSPKRVEFVFKENLV